eukprot:2726484-Amphidinium_carterae.1
MKVSISPPEDQCEFVVHRGVAFFCSLGFFLGALVGYSSCYRSLPRCLEPVLVGLAYSCCFRKRRMVDIGSLDLQQRIARVGTFLLTSLQPATQVRYQAALDEFHDRLSSLGLHRDSLSGVELDAFLAEFVVELFEETNGETGYAHAAVLVASHAKTCPHLSFTLSWKSLDCWRVRQPPRQAPALPQVVAFAAANLLVLLDRCAVGACIAVCFAGLLRISEALRLTWQCFHRVAHGWIAVLGVTKRGLEQTVSFTSPGLVQWLDAYAVTCSAISRSTKVFNMSYPTVTKWLRRATDYLGFGRIPWTTHSLRRGGATALISQGHSFESVILFGHWASSKTAREYIRRGEVAVLQLRSDVPQDAWAKAQHFTSLGSQVWQLRPL